MDHLRRGADRRQLLLERDHVRSVAIPGERGVTPRRPVRDGPAVRTCLEDGGTSDVTQRCVESSSGLDDVEPATRRVVPDTEGRCAPPIDDEPSAGGRGRPRDANDVRRTSASTTACQARRSSLMSAGLITRSPTRHAVPRPPMSRVGAALAPNAVSTSPGGGEPGVAATSGGRASGTGARGSPRHRRSGPVWTSDGWMIVDDGATSQWKRSAIDSAAIGPGGGVAGGDPHDRVEVRPHVFRVAVGRERRQHGRRRARPARRGTGAAGDIRTIPALNASPRSTRGTTRTIAYSNGLRGPGTVGLLDERARRLEPRAAGSRRTPGDARRDRAGRPRPAASRRGSRRPGLEQAPA